MILTHLFVTDEKWHQHILFLFQGINSTCRSIDLAIGILAPILVGQVMHWIPPRTSAIFFAAWNVGSFFVEYGLLVVVYEQFPALAVKDLPPQVGLFRSTVQHPITELAFVFPERQRRRRRRDSEEDTTFGSVEELALVSEPRCP